MFSVVPEIVRAINDVFTVIAATIPVIVNDAACTNSSVTLMYRLELVIVRPYY